MERTTIAVDPATAQYRPGGHWGVTIVREGTEPADAHGHRPDAQLVAVVVNGDRALAERICDLLNVEGSGEAVEGSGEALARLDADPGRATSYRDEAQSLSEVDVEIYE